MKSLSIVMPVYNAARHLTQHIEFLVELLPQVASEFQVIIVDDGSSDSTGDIVQELNDRFTQVEAVFRTTRHGEIAAIDAGMRKARFEMVFVQNQSEVVESKIKQFLSGTKLPALKVEAEQLNTEDRLIERLMQWGLALKEHRSKQAAEETDTLAINSAPPIPKYASMAEKRLMELCQRENARIDLE